MKIKIDTQLWAYLFGDLTDKERLDMIKTLIMSHSDAYSFKENLINVVKEMEID